MPRSRRDDKIGTDVSLLLLESMDDAAELRFDWILVGDDEQLVVARSSVPLLFTHAVVKSSSSKSLPLPLIFVYLLSNTFIFSNIWLSFLALPAASSICCASGDVVVLVGDEFVDLIRRPFLSYKFCDDRDDEFRLKEPVCDGVWKVSFPNDGRVLFVARPFHVLTFLGLVIFVCGVTSLATTGFRTDR